MKKRIKIEATVLVFCDLYTFIKESEMMKKTFTYKLLLSAILLFLTAGNSYGQAMGHASVGLGHGEEGYLHLEEMIKHVEFSLRMDDASPELKKHGQAALQHAQEALNHYNEALKHASEALGRPMRNEMMSEGSQHDHSHEEGSGYGSAPAPRHDEGSHH